MYPLLRKPIIGITTIGAEFSPGWHCEFTAIYRVDDEEKTYVATVTSNCTIRSKWMEGDCFSRNSMLKMGS